MPIDVPAPTHVLTLVFLGWTAGVAVFAVWSRTFRDQERGEIQPGHFKVTWLVVAGLAFAAGFGYHRAWLVAVLALATFAAIYKHRDRESALVTGAASLVALGAGAPVFGLAVAALLGSVTNAMLLGHWHLNQPRLGTKPIARLVYGTWAGLVVYLGACTVLILTGTGLTVFAAVTAAAFTIFAGVLTAMVAHLVRTRSIMSATGILYLEILLCFVAAFTGSLAALARR